MRTLLKIVYLSLCVFLVGITAVSAQGGEKPAGRDPVEEQEILDRLAEISPEAVPIFQEATEAFDAGDYPAAQVGYERVLELAPDFPDALRRLAGAVLNQGQTALAIDYARRARALDPSPANEAALAAALALSDKTTEQSEALAHAQNAVKAAPNDPDYLKVLAYAAYQIEYWNDAEDASARLIELEPEDPFGYYFSGYAALGNEQWARAESRLLEAQELGWGPPEEFDYPLALAHLGLAIDSNDFYRIRQAARTLIEVAPDNPTGYYNLGIAQANLEQWEEAEVALLQARELGWSGSNIDEYLAEVRREMADAETESERLDLLVTFGYGVGVWLASFVVLFGVGMLLSRVTLAAVNSTRFTPEHDASAIERGLRTVYRAVIGLASVYYYISLPVLALIVLVLAGGILYAFFEAGRIPIQFTIALVGGSLITVGFLLRSLFVRPRDEEPGKPLTRQDAQDLWTVTDEVAARLRTRPIEAIYVAPHTGIAVMERGKFWDRLRHRTTRTLILGLGALPALNQGQFKAILAHEYGHFAHGDTAGGQLAHRVNTAMLQTARDLAREGLARLYNPAWVFLSFYYRVFQRITLGASRLQEVLADRYAALAYGPENLSSGLAALVRQDTVFDVQINREYATAVQEHRPLQNLWALPPVEEPSICEKIDMAVAQAMNRPTSPYDSHPAPNKRIALMQRITPVEPVNDNLHGVWELLPEAEKLQQEMTTTVQRQVKHYNMRSPVKSEEVS